MSTSTSPSLLVIGGSVAGLATALFAARRGCRVTVIDADTAAGPAPIDEARARDPRMRTPQAAHSHAFLARAVQVLEEECPEALADMEAHGVHRLSLEPPAGLTRASVPVDAPSVLLARRTTFEAVLRNAVDRRQDVTLRPGTSATGLRLTPGRSSVPQVVGVETDRGQLSADLIVDATGRRGRVHRWLRDAGIDVDEQDSDCGIAYHSRFYVRRPGASWGPLNRGYTAGSSFDRYSCLVFPGDRASFSVTFGTLPEDRELDGLRDRRGFQAAAEEIELVREWVDPEVAEPISDVRTMTRMRNRVRRIVREGRPMVSGLALVADAAAISNPAHSRGCALALVHARHVAEQAATATDPAAFTLQADQGVVDHLAPWVADSEKQDAARLSRWRPDANVISPTVEDGRVSNGEAWVASHHDPVVWDAFTRLQQLLALPDEVLADADIVARVRRTQQSGLGVPGLSAPAHETLAGLLRDASHASSPDTAWRAVG